MDTKDAILGRRSIRRYSDQEVPLDLVGEILELAKHAPSSGNLQNWKFVIVTKRDVKEKLAEACLEQYWMVEAPIHIVVCNDYDKVKEHYGKMGRMFSIQNCAAVSYAIMLAAHEKGLGSCWVGGFDPDAVQRELGIPDNMDPEIIIPIGYSNDKKADSIREDLHYLTFVDSWGNREKKFEAFKEFKKKLDDIQERF